MNIAMWSMLTITPVLTTFGVRLGLKTNPPPGLQLGCLESFSADKGQLGMLHPCSILRDHHGCTKVQGLHEEAVIHRFSRPGIQHDYQLRERWQCFVRHPGKGAMTWYKMQSTYASWAASYHACPSKCFYSFCSRHYTQHDRYVHTSKAPKYSMKHRTS